jgi:uncharacterized protein YbjT (DUF2867 family)
MQPAHKDRNLRKTVLLGADGFIGRHLAYGLRDLGHQVTCVARQTQALAAMGFDTITADFTTPQTQTPEYWREKLAGMDHVVNTAGLLNAPQAAFQAVHVTTPDAIYTAMPDASTGVLISAVGIEADTDFSKYRRAGETTALSHSITALRCGLVLADTSYGGSSLIRALSALPIVTPLPSGPDPQFNPIHATDLAAVVDAALRTLPTSNPIDIGGPETIGLRAMLAQHRTWLGQSKSRELTLPSALMSAFGCIGDLFKMGPISRTSIAQIKTGVLADTTAMTEQIKAKPRPFSQFINARPVGTSDLWHARLYLMKPAVRLTLAFLWLLSGILGLFLPTDAFLPLIDTSLSDATLVAMARAGGVIDLLIALALMRDWWPKRITQLQFAMVLGYTLAFTFLNPALWLLPLGGLLKNIPILMFLLTHAILQKGR